ncbi:AAA family ATPase [Actibacterium sp. 188UL27-1]|uniref:AAA family ATPase n=1 Tax=Actibacterium sp. 188UL27-1 TaxID=2786961 RepID=UPI001957A178|nr:AAA family ATPase [Actibacterium sp. 188UL27-1]MBM7067733.1 AAA family ATPase [Actibacterium sp. 188UL27-1]
MFNDIQNFAQTAMRSDVFAAGLALGLIGFALGFLRFGYGTVAELIRRRFAVTLTLDNRAMAYRDVLAWLNSTNALSHTRRMRVTGAEDAGTEMLGPADGGHWFRIGRYLCHLDREMDAKARVSSHTGTMPLERIVLTVFFGSRALLEDWLAQGRAIVSKRDRIGPGLYIHRTDWWDHVGDVPARALSSVLCDDNRIEQLARDVSRFYAGQAWYAERGVPWRRGYLLYGPPGTGKSSVIRALASHLDRDIATIDLGRTNLSDDELREAMFSAPKGALLAMEDVDAVFRERSADQARGISFSGLLNAIDGVGAQEGHALFLTTNHRDRLDPALVRGGRADVHMELGHVSAATARALFLRFFPDSRSEADMFEHALGDRRFAPATLQAWLLETADDPIRAAKAGPLTERTTLAAE